MEKQKLKLLCFHGFRQNKETFRQKLGSLRKALKSIADLDFIEGPHDVGDGTKGWWFSAPDRVFISKEESSMCEGFTETCALVESKLKEEKYDGLLGFSQGAALVALIASSIRAKDIKGGETIRFLILVAGFRSLSSPHLHLYDNPIDFPSLHIIGDTDNIISKERSEALAAVFLNAEIARHPGGHYVPASKDFKDSYVTFLNKYIEF